jgi:hypothetical protein
MAKRKKNRKIEEFMVGRKPENGMIVGPGEWVYFTEEPEGSIFHDGKNRYTLWNGGCGIGHANTKAEAREKLFEYVLKQIDAKVLETAERLDELTKIQYNLLRKGTGALKDYETQR